MKKKIYIGIDPDVDKSGVAYYEKDTKVLELSNLRYFQLYDYLKSIKEKQIDEEILVRVECGFLNQSNWHKVKGTANINAKIGERTGANFETAKKICEMCEYLGLKHEKVKPTRRKLNHKEFAQITNIINRTNQEQRDAGMLVYEH